jgi:hypothetical protein
MSLRRPSSQRFPPRPRPARETKATFPCPLCLGPLPPAEVTATFDGEGNLTDVAGTCHHAQDYGLLDQPEVEALALISAAVSAAVRGA